MHNVEDRFREAAALHGQGRLVDAMRLYEQIVAAAPTHVNALCNLSALYRRLGRTGDALTMAERALAADPGLAAAHAGRADALTMLGRLDAALASYDAALALNPAFADAHANRGNVLRELGRAEEAVAACDRALALRPGFAGAHVFRGYALLELERAQEALASFDAGLVRDARHVRAHVGRGRALSVLRRFDQALRSFDAALAGDPNFAQAHFHKALALVELGRRTEALACASRAVALNPAFAGAYLCRANILLDLGRPEEAVRDFKAYHEHGPNLPNGLGHYVHAKTFVCEWDGLEGLVDRLGAEIRADKRAAYPFALIALSDDPALQRACAQRQAQIERPAQGVVEPLSGGSGERIKVAYFSSDFCDHPVAHLIAPSLGCHDRARFEIVAFSLGERRDEHTARIRAAVDDFVDASAMGAGDIVNRARAAKIDIAIDLNGYTKGARTNLFASRMAPVQMSYAGYLGTMGAPFMDYLAADATLIPPQQRAHYGEKIVYLPWYQCNDANGYPARSETDRARHGLPDDAFVFASFNSNFKLMPETFELWMRILQRTPKSVLWLYAPNARAADNLRAEAAKRGVDRERIVFAERVSRGEHLARQSLADLMLDTFPCSGGATSCNAIWAGTPVLTRAGRSFASRMGASLLGALDLTDLVVESAQAYEDCAVRLATHPDELLALRRRVSMAPSTPAFSAQAFTRNLEQAYAVAAARARAGLAAEDIVVVPR